MVLFEDLKNPSPRLRDPAVRPRKVAPLEVPEERLALGAPDVIAFGEFRGEI